MRTLAAILILSAALAIGQTTQEPFVLISTNAAESSGNVWRLQWVEDRQADSWWHWYFERGGVIPSTPLPAMVWIKYGLSVTVTGTEAQAKADLRAMDDARRPEKAALENFLGGLTPVQFRQSLLAAYLNVHTNTAFSAAQRRVLTNLIWAINAEDDFTAMREAKRAEDESLGIKKEQ